MPFRVIGDPADLREPAACVELRSLEGMRRQEHLATAAASGYLLGPRHQLGTEAALSKVFPDPKSRDLARAAPRVTVESRGHHTALVTHEYSEETTVLDPCRSGVELVQAIAEERHILGRRLVHELELFVHE